MKTNINAEILSVQVLEATILEFRKRVNEYSDSASGMWKRIREDIRTGKVTTGSAIQDFVILKYDKLNMGYVNALDDLEERLTGKEGQFILLVESKLQESLTKLYAYPHRSNMIPPPSFHTVISNFSLGIISGDALIMDSIPVYKCFLPTKQFLYYGSGIGLSHVVWLCNMPIVGSYTDDRDFITQSKKEFYHNGRRYLEMEVLIGDKEVGGWFAKEKNIQLFKNGAKLLGRPLEQEQEGSPYLGLSWRV